MRERGVLRFAEGDHVLFWCPGCKAYHAIRVGDGPGPRWKWDGAVDWPTITPSILVTGEELTEQGERDMEEWEKAGHPSRDGKPFETRPMRCHSFITDGMIRFLEDSTHELAGRTVELTLRPEAR